MGNFKMLIPRFQSMSLKRMKMYIDEINKNFGKNKAATALDMCNCLVRYGTGYLDYTVFGFANIHGKARKTFMTNAMNRKVSMQTNNPAYSHFLKNKSEFHETYKDFTGRSFLDLTNASAEEFKNFCNGKEKVFIKNPVSFGGQGVRCYHINEITDFDALYNELKADGFILVEEEIIQHRTLHDLCPSCINSLRVVTLRGDDGKFYFLYSLLRIGSGAKDVDNITSGGMYMLLDDNGKSISRAFCDKTALYYDTHPMTGVQLKGFQVPLFKEAIELCLKAAEVVPEIGYVGWDVAITENGPVLIEGNVLPGYDMAQNTNLSGKKEGILPKVRTIPGFETLK